VWRESAPADPCGIPARGSPDRLVGAPECWLVLRFILNNNIVSSCDWRNHRAKNTSRITADVRFSF
jgi:hypothetical protein